MIYADQNIHLSHGMTSIRLVFGEHSLDLSYRQSEDLAWKLLEQTAIGRRANPPAIKAGDRVRCLYGRSRGQLATVLSGDGPTWGLAFASNIVGVGYESHELELIEE